MNSVLWVLAAGAVVLGFFQEPLLAFLEPALGASQSGTIGHHGWLPVAASLLAVLAIGLAWFEFGRRHSRQHGFVERIPALSRLFSERWYLDRLYRTLLDKVVYQGISRLFTWNDRTVIDGTVDGCGGITVLLGSWIGRLHTTMIQYRLMVMAAVVVLLVFTIGFGG